MDAPLSVRTSSHNNNTFSISSDVAALTEVKAIRSVYLELTDNCLLQCLYCTPYKRTNTKTIDEAGKMRFQDFIAEINGLNQVYEVILGGFGEITMVPGWDNVALAVDELGIGLNCITSLSKRLTENEWDAFSRFRHMVMSVDTVDIDHFKHVRRGGDSRAIIYNMMRIRAKARLREQEGPQFSWASVIYHEMLPDYAVTIETAIAAGVTSFELNSLFHRDDSPRAVTSIAEVSDEDFVRDQEYIKKALEIICARGCTYSMSGGIRDILEERQERLERKKQSTAAENLESMPEAGMKAVHVGYINSFVRQIPEGYTKNCLQPWTQMHLKVSGHVIPCCEPFVATGNWKAQNGDTLANNAIVRKIREGLLTGNMHPTCATCRITGIMKVEEFQERIRNLLAGRLF